MVTFSLPGDNDVGDVSISTPKPRPPLPFAKRAFSASTMKSSSAPAKRLGTPQASSVRKLFMTRDQMPSSDLSNSSIATARNIFRASAISSPPAGPFSPSLPQSAMKKVFAPGVTPESARVYRQGTAQATPRGVAAKATEKDLFSMRIASPPPELTGAALAQKVPKEWNSKGSIYADQFLAHLCPTEFDEEQRRQFFCILDLRRLKYAADEIFSKKNWKLNVTNFAKEFEKSRSIILLRYGLYEFQNVKPSKEVLKRWRREHGLPDVQDEDAEPTPTKQTASKKRKADDDTAKGVRAATAPASNKRRAMGKDEDEETPAASTLNKNKRKASVSDEVGSQPNKMPKPTSASAALFGQIAEKHSTTPSATPAKPVARPAEETSAPKSNLFATQKPLNGGLARSVFTNIKAGQAQGATGGSNIFGYLSDASSAKNSGVEADAESEADSEPDDSPDAGQSDEPSVAASGGAETLSQTRTNLFGQPATGASSTPETRESTPGRSLFDRVTKNSDGQPARADMIDVPTEQKTAPVDQTWNPSSTPIKFAPSNANGATPSALFGASTTAPASSVFAPKSTTTSNIFGGPKREQPAEKPASVEATSDTQDKDGGGESDKENDDQASKKSLFDSKPSAPQPSFGSSIFQPKPAAPETSKDLEAPKPASNLFASAAKPDPASGMSTPSNMFGSLTKPSESSSAAPPVMQSSTLFGAAPADVPPTDAPKPAPIFGASKPADNGTAAPTTLFGAKPVADGKSLFGAPPSTSTSQPLFGAAANTAPAQPSSTPIFSFGSDKPKEPSLQPAAKPIFGIPKSPPNGVNSNALFGSPMKQDDPSPAKKAFTGGSNTSGAAPLFGFGASQNQPQANVFGNAPATAPGRTGPANLGGASGSSGGFNFNFGAGGATTASSSSFNNPFASGNAGGDKAAPVSSGSMFTFGGSSAPSAPSAGGGSIFQFGGPSAGSTAQAGAPIFGGYQAGSSTPLFGGSSTPGGAPALNLTAASPQPPQNNGSLFGGNQPAPAFGNLQAPAGGASTTGTNSPFSFGGGSSLATTPAGGTPEPSSQGEAAKGGAEEEEGEKHEQINLTEGLEADEVVVHDVRAKVLKFVPAGEKTDDDKPKSKSPWSTQGVGPLRLLKHKETNAVRLLLRAEPRGHIAMNRAVLADMSYKADEKYVKMTTSNETGDGLETWMIQVKTKDLAKELSDALEKYKVFNKKA